MEANKTDRRRFLAVASACTLFYPTAAYSVLPFVLSMAIRTTIRGGLRAVARSRLARGLKSARRNRPPTKQELIASYSVGLSIDASITVPVWEPGNQENSVEFALTDLRHGEYEDYFEVNVVDIDNNILEQSMHFMALLNEDVASFKISGFSGARPGRKRIQARSSRGITIQPIKTDIVYVV